MNIEQLLGPLFEIYNTKNTCEIFVDYYDDVYYSLIGKNVNAENIFKSSDEVMQVIQRVADAFDKDLTSCHSFTVNFEDQTFFKAVLPPVSNKGPFIYIRKMIQQNFGFEELIKWKAATEEDEKKIKDLIHSGKSVIVAGNVGSGKTTLLNIVAAQIKEEWRVVTIEKQPEISLPNRKRLTQLVTPNNKNDELCALVELASEMRGDYTILNEMMGSEVMPYIEMIRNGVSGIATITAENVFDAIKKIEYKAMAYSSFIGGIEDLRYAICQAFHAIIFQERRNDGSRVISKIAALEYNDGQIQLNVL